MPQTSWHNKQKVNAVRFSILFTELRVLIQQSSKGYHLFEYCLSLSINELGIFHFSVSKLCIKSLDSQLNFKLRRQFK